MLNMMALGRKRGHHSFSSPTFPRTEKGTSLIFLAYVPNISDVPFSVPFPISVMSPFPFERAGLVILAGLSVVRFHDPFDPLVERIVECYLRPVLFIVPSPGQMRNRVTPIVRNMVQDVIVVFPASDCSRLLPVKDM